MGLHFKGSKGGFSKNPFAGSKGRAFGKRASFAKFRAKTLNVCMKLAILPR